MPSLDAGHLIRAARGGGVLLRAGDAAQYLAQGARGAEQGFFKTPGRARGPLGLTIP
jgi:hypothetical protein